MNLLNLLLNRRDEMTTRRRATRLGVEAMEGRVALSGVAAALAGTPAPPVQVTGGGHIHSNIRAQY